MVVTTVAIASIQWMAQSSNLGLELISYLAVNLSLCSKVTWVRTDSWEMCNKASLDPRPMSTKAPKSIMEPCVVGDSVSQRLAVCVLQMTPFDICWGSLHQGRQRTTTPSTSCPMTRSSSLYFTGNFLRLFWFASRRRVPPLLSCLGVSGLCAGMVGSSTATC